MHTRETAQKVVDPMRINYNFVRAFNNKDALREGWNKIGARREEGEENLIRLAANKKCKK